LSEIHQAAFEYREVQYLFAMRLLAWPTHEVTISRIFVHPFCMYLPTPGENDCQVKRSIIHYSAHARALLASPSGTAFAPTASLIRPSLAPQTAEARYHRGQFF
jgi:hypothetical protein